MTGSHPPGFVRSRLLCMPLRIHNLLRDGRSGAPVAGTAILVVLMNVISECTLPLYGIVTTHTKEVCVLFPPCGEPVICSGHTVGRSRRHLIDQPVQLNLGDHPHLKVRQLVATCEPDQMLNLFLAESSWPPCSYAMTGIV